MGIEANFYAYDAEARDALTFPKVTPKRWLLGQTQTSALLPAATADNGQRSTAFGCGGQSAIRDQQDNPSSLWRREEGKGRGWGLCDFLIPEYTLFSFTGPQQVFLFLP